MVAPRGGDSSDGMCFRDRSAVQVPGSSTTASRKESMVPTLPGVRIILTSSDILQDFFLESLAQWLWNVLKLCGWTQLLLKAFVAKCQKRGRWSLQIHLECLACTNKFAVFAVFAVLLLISGFNYWNLPRICNGLSFVNPTLCNWCLCNLCNTMIPLWSLCIFCQEHPRASKSRPRAVQEQSELPEACQRSVAEHRLQPHSQPKRLASANLNQHGNITTIHSCHISVPGSWG